jgi:hypothetical protein
MPVPWIRHTKDPWVTSTGPLIVTRLVGAAEAQVADVARTGAGVSIRWAGRYGQGVRRRP